MERRSERKGLTVKEGAGEEFRRPELISKKKTGGEGMEESGDSPYLKA